MITARGRAIMNKDSERKCQWPDCNAPAVVFLEGRPEGEHLCALHATQVIYSPENIAMTVFGPDGFYSAKLRIVRAQEHLNDLKAQINRFFGEKPYSRIVEPDPNGTHKIYKIRLTKPFPFRWRILATEIIEHSRASLDHATWASAFLYNLVFSRSPIMQSTLRTRLKDSPRIARLKSKRF
jgi:hypothetical protein